MNFELANAIAILGRTPQVLRVLLEDLPEVWVMNNEGGASWSPYDVLGHLIHGEQTDWMVRADIILGEGAKSFEAFDRFAQFENSKGKNLTELLSEFECLRSENLNLLTAKNLTASQLSLKGEHPELGTVTLAQLLATWVVHDLGHITQISRVMAKQYATEVGPWKKYLTILEKQPRED